MLPGMTAGREVVRWVVLGALAVGALGCGDQACIQWSEAEGACPSRKEAIRFMAPPCDEPIVSIDSDGEFDGQACCYDVTKDSRDGCSGQAIE